MAEWGQTEELLASIVDVLVAANSRKGTRWTYPRPGVEPDGVRTVKPKKTRTKEELQAVLAEKWARGDREVAGNGG